MIVAYSVDGSALEAEDGALRIAFVSDEDDQVIDSKKSAKQLAEIEVQ